MSKKTKRLEKENLNLTKKQEATNKNIVQMAEERTQSQQTVDRLTRENEKLKTLCRAMQTSGYAGAGGAAANVDPTAEFDEGLEGETESEYEDEEYDEDEEGEYDDDTDEEYGPPPPPDGLYGTTNGTSAHPNGTATATAAAVNGVRQYVA